MAYRIALVDDDRNILTSVSMVLEAEGFGVTQYRDGAEARSGQKPAEVLKATADSLTADSWPAPLLHYFLGRVSGDQLLAAAVKDPAEAKGRACEAYYFLGQAALLSKDARQAIKLFQAALATGMSRHTEYVAAKAELARLGQRP